MFVQRTIQNPQNMIRAKQQSPYVIDLTGPQGNAFFLLGTASKLAKDLGFTQEAHDKLLVDMKSNDYEHLIKVFDDTFGELVILER